MWSSLLDLTGTEWGSVSEVVHHSAAAPGVAAGPCYSLAGLTEVAVAPCGSWYPGHKLITAAVPTCLIQRSQPEVWSHASSLCTVGRSQGHRCNTHSPKQKFLNLAANRTRWDLQHAGTSDVSK
jgi:hypothetical protein